MNMFNNWGTFMCHIIVYTGCAVCVVGALAVVAVVLFGCFSLINSLCVKFRQRNELTLICGYIMVRRMLKRREVRNIDRERVLQTLVRRMGRCEKRNLIDDIEDTLTDTPAGTIGKLNVALYCHIHAMRNLRGSLAGLIAAAECGDSHMLEVELEDAKQRLAEYDAHPIPEEPHL